MDLELNDEVALVSGGNRGTGFIIASRLAKEGCKVMLHGFDESSAREAAESIEGSHPVWGDLCTDTGAEQVIKQVLDLGKLSILVNNYGTATPGKWEKHNSENWIDIYEKNVLSAARLISGFLPHMRNAGWGRIIQLSTIGSISPNSIMPHYYASKGAFSNMTVSLCKELSGTGITVNTVSPGLIKTPELVAAYTLKAERKDWGKEWVDIEKKIVELEFPNPSMRLAEREEVADLVCFLASKRANYVNGQNIRIDGGAIGLSV